MLPGAMKCLAVAFAGACSVLSACVMHKDTTFAPPPLPAETTSATRIVVSSGVMAQGPFRAVRAPGRARLTPG